MQTTKNKPLAISGGFPMRATRISSDGQWQSWRCVKKSCNGSAKSYVGEYSNLFTINLHNHISSPTDIKIRERIISVKQKAKENLAVPSLLLVEESKTGLSDHEIISMPKDKAIQRTISYARKPIGGHTIDVDLIDIQWNVNFTTTINQEQFLLYDSREDDLHLPIFFIFASQRHLQLLKKYERWSIDGTFFCAPKNFLQLYTINAFVNDSSLPIVYILLPSKNVSIYDRAFTKLFHEYIPNCNPQLIISDFERAPSSVLKEIFPNVKISFCLFHLSQNCYKNLQNFRISHLYNTNQELRIYLRCLPALSFLPLEEVELTFDLIRAKCLELTPNEYESDMENYFTYFRNTYVKFIDVNGNSYEALFKMELWNVRSNVLNNFPRTNNAIESWHRNFNRRFLKRDLNLSAFIIRLKQEEEQTRQQFLLHEINPASPVRGRGRNKKMFLNEKQIVKLVENYNYNYTHSVEFCQKIQYHLKKFSF